MASTKERGNFGEAFALSVLEGEGYRLLARNWRHGHSEIDLILEREKTIVFLEVKTRSASSLGTPAESVSRAQRRRIALAAAAYLISCGIYNTGEYQPRFDLFEVVTDRPDSPNIVRYAHLPAAYDMEGLNVYL